MILNFSLSFLNLLLVFTIYFVLKLFSTLYLNAKNFFYQNKNLNNILILSESEIKYYILLQFLFINSFKTLPWYWSNNNNIIFLFLYIFLSAGIMLIYLLSAELVSRVAINTVGNITLWFYLLITSLFLIDNFINLFLLLEFLAILYYFFFLQQTSLNLRNYIKLKNILSLYLWLSFFTLIFFFSCLLVICFQIGTLNFVEVNYLSNKINMFSWLLILISLFFKLGVSGFHFLKFEIYKYLPSHALFFFSIYTLYLNSVILFYLIINLWSIFILCAQPLIYFILFINIILLFRSYKITSFYQFLAFSAINTWSLIILFLVC